MKLTIQVVETEFKPRLLYPPQASIRIPDENLLSHGGEAEIMHRLGNSSADGITRK